MTNDTQTIFDCGCSRHKVAAGRCDLYDEQGNPRAEIPKLHPVCRDNIGNIAVLFESRSRDAHTKANELRETDAASFAEQECVAATWSAAAGDLWDLLGRKVFATDPYAMGQAQDPNAVMFDEALVERLAGKMREELGQEPQYYDWTSCAKIVLTELVQREVELPGDYDIMRIMVGSDAFDELPAEERIDQRAIDIAWFLRRTLGPMLAAKDAHIAYLSRLRKVIANQQSSNNALTKRVAELELDLQSRDKHIAELEESMSERIPAHVLQKVRDRLAGTGAAPAEASLHEDMLANFDDELAKHGFDITSKVAPLDDNPIIVGEHLWPGLNERRCHLIRKVVANYGLAPIEKVEHATLDAVANARDELLSALANLRSSGLDALEVAFANSPADRGLGTFSRMDDETTALCTGALHKLTQKLNENTLEEAERQLLIRLQTLLDPRVISLLRSRAKETRGAKSIFGRVIMGVSFERETPTGERLPVDASSVSLLIDGVPYELATRVNRD